MELRVEDDGAGAAAGGSGVPGNGLTGLRERVEGVGGTLEAAPVRDRGFLLVARVPVGSVGSAA